MESRFFEHSIFRTSRFFKLWHVSLGFASVKHCNFTPDVSKLSLFRTNSYLPRKKFIRNLSSISQTLRKVLLSSFYLNGHTFTDSKVRPTFYYTKNSTKERSVQYLSFEWSFFRPGFPAGTVYHMYKVVLTFESSKILSVTVQMKAKELYKSAIVFLFAFLVVKKQYLVK